MKFIVDRKHVTLLPNCVSLCLVLQRAVDNGAKGVKEPWKESDEHGSVVMATVQTVCNIHSHINTHSTVVLWFCIVDLPLLHTQYGDTTHTFVERTNYSDQHFLPGFVMGSTSDPVLDGL